MWNEKLCCTTGSIRDRDNFFEMKGEKKKDHNLMQIMEISEYKQVE